LVIFVGNMQKLIAAQMSPNKGFQDGQITVGFLFVPHLF
jgi:hypothetical protein